MNHVEKSRSAKSPNSFFFTLVIRERIVFPREIVVSLSKKVKGYNLSVRQKRILAFALARGGGFSSSQYRTVNGVNRDATYREIKELREMGLVVPSRSSRSSIYRLNRKLETLPEEEKSDESGDNGRGFRNTPEAAH